ncbi:hypothetical protein BOTBODRAFT_84523, partial [Botryobasidium botryosum FD-172 SS1]
IMRVLLDAGADLEAKDDHGDTPLSLASKNGRASSVRFLLDRGANQTTCGKNGCITPQLIDKPGGIDAVATLIRKGAELNAQNDFGQTALAAAAANGSAPAIQLLLDHRADPRIYDQD